MDSASESDPNELVYLSDSEIEDFRGALRNSKVIVGISRDATDFAVESFLDFAESQLRLQKVRRRMIAQLVPEILKQLTEFIPDDSPELGRGSTRSRSAKIEEGAFVGITATEALCGPITQATLKTFHHAGSAVSVSSGNEAISEILSVKRNRKTFRTKVFFNDRLSFDQVYGKLHEFVSTTMSSLIIDRDIEVFSNDKAEYWHPTTVSDAVEDTQGKSYCQSGDLFVRLKLNLDVLVERQIDMDLLKERLEGAFNADLIVCSPLSKGIIDIFPDMNNAIRACVDNVINGQKEITNEAREYANRLCSGDSGNSLDKFMMLYIRNGILPTLDEIVIKGINKISYFVPQVQNIFGSCIYQQVDYSPEEWYYPVNKISMCLFGVDFNRLREIFETFGFVVSRETRFGLFVTKSGVETPNNPRDYINKLLQDKSDAFQESEQYLVCNIVYAITLGTNLKEILKRSDVNPALTLSNDFNEILNTYGVEACRNHVMTELNEYITSSGQEIGSRHLFLLGDLMTYKGDMTAINYHGVAKQQEGILAKVAYERGFGILSNAANVGSLDEYFKGSPEAGYKNIMPTSTGILTGQFVSNTKAVVRPLDVLQKLKQLKANGELKFFSPQQEIDLGIRVVEETERSEGVEEELKGVEESEQDAGVVFGTMETGTESSVDQALDQALDIVNLTVSEPEDSFESVKQSFINGLYGKSTGAFEYSVFVV